MLGAATAGIGDCLVSQPIELAGLGVALDLAVEARGLEFLEPGAKAGELVGRQLGDGFFDVFDGAHGSTIARRIFLVMAGLDPAIHVLHAAMS